MTVLAEPGTMAATGQIERLNHLLHEYGESVRRFFREQQRSSMVSPLFNIPGRMVLALIATTRTWGHCCASSRRTKARKA